MKKLIITGGTGFLGTALAKYFSPKVEEIVILGRSQKKDFDNVRYSRWHLDSPEPWWQEFNGADAVINMAGKNVDCRYTPKNKEAIYASRLVTTRLIGEAIKKCAQPPKVWINAASATIYRDAQAKLMTEANGEIGDDFSMDVCKRWEQEFNKAVTVDTRKVILRTSIVLGHDGGAFVPLAKLVRTGLGGAQGEGTQQCSWIHEHDFCRAVEWILMTDKASGIYNVTSPNPIDNRKFMKALRGALNVSVGLPIGRTLLQLGALLIGTETELVLKSRNVYPERLVREGFVFRYPTIQQAFSHLAKQATT